MGSIMSCNNYKIMISGYLDGQLSPKNTARLDSHLRHCEICREELAALQKVKDLCRQLRHPLPDDQQWGEFSDRLFGKLQNIQQRRSGGFIAVLGYAAGVLLLLTISLFLFLLGPSTTNDSYSAESISLVPTVRAELAIGEISHNKIKVQPKVPGYDLNQIKGLAQARLTTDELAFLRRNGFVVTSRQFSSFVQLYRENQQKDIPSFVTVDTAISGISHILARLQVDLERGVFFAKLTIFTQKLRDSLIRLHRHLPKNCHKASIRALAFSKIASVLLDCDGEWPEEIEREIGDAVSRELTLIYNGRRQQAIGIQKSPIFQYDIDYTKFKIRWNETNEDKLRRYYLALEWYSRCVFRTSSLSETRSALLILLATLRDSSEGIIIWEEMNQLLSILYGESDDLNLQDYQRIARETYGDCIIPQALSDGQKLQHFCRLIERRKIPRIRSEIGLKGGLRLFGGRYYARDMMLQQLCYPFVGEVYDPRMLPSILDIAVIMQYPKAVEIAQEKDFFHFKHYRAKIENYRLAIQQQLHNSFRPWQKGGLISDLWIYESLTSLEGRGYPYFCRSQAWQSRKLTSILCGLVKLANSRPTFTAQRSGNFTATVDPYPEFFNRMVTVIRNLETLLQLVGYPLDRAPARELLAYKHSLLQAATVAQKMLSGQLLSQEEQNQLGDFVLGWEGNYQEANISELSTLFHRNHTQADFYLHAGVEPVRELWVACPGRTIPYLARGGIYLLYEFPTGKKVLPKQWRKLQLWNRIKKKDGIEEFAPWIKPFLQQK